MRSEQQVDAVLIFVYGTLMRDGSRAAALADQRFIADAQTKPEYRLYDCGSYPGLVEDGHGLSIYGELWSVNRDCLERLDRIEAVDEGLYVRQVVQLASPYERDIVQTYVYAQSVDGMRDCGERWINPA